MIELKSADSLVIPSRGTVYTFHGVKDLNPRALLNAEVLIDGRRYVVLGVESNTIPDVTGLPFGLLVDSSHAQ